MRRAQAVVRVVARLVLDEVFGRGQLADVVVERADAREQAVRADGARGVLGQPADGVRVLVRPRRAQRQLAEHRQVRVRQLQQPHVGQNPEQRLADGEEPGRENRRQQPAAEPAGGRERDRV
jgi:hypothetical protein